MRTIKQRKQIWNNLLAKQAGEDDPELYETFANLDQEKKVFPAYKVREDGDFLCKSCAEHLASKAKEPLEIKRAKVPLNLIMKAFMETGDRSIPCGGFERPMFHSCRRRVGNVKE